MPTTDDHIAAITRDQLRVACDELRDLADKLDRFREGNSDAWTSGDTLNGYLLLTAIQSHTAVTRALRGGTDRAGSVVRLDDRR